MPLSAPWVCAASKLTAEQTIMNFKMKSTRHTEDRMSDLSYKFMNALFVIADAIYPTVDRRIPRFGIHPGMTVVDYGCGPGRYTQRFARVVGETGKVYAVDIHELAIQSVKQKIIRYNLSNVEPVLADGYHSGLPAGTADVVCAIDMFFSVHDPDAFLKELSRITKPTGFLIIDDGHQSRRTTKEKIKASGYWRIQEETSNHLKCIHFD
jgi:ubiquinone/menaquinone biosynthesis C-methylase UbiE